MSQALEAARRYFDAWNRHDGPAVAGLFTEAGTYQDPTLPKPLSHEAIAGYVKGLVAIFPDLSFEIRSEGQIGPDMVVAEWVMRGTNTTPFQGLPPTGRTVSLPGVDIIKVDGDRIHSVRGYFDQKTMSEQLGLQVIVQPEAVGPVTFGKASRFSLGSMVKPGAFGITTIQLSSPAEDGALRAFGLQIANQMAALPGFISATYQEFGLYMTTTTAWTDAESAMGMARDGAHREAMAAMMKRSGLGRQATTMIAVLDHGRVFMRCDACGAMGDFEASSTCRCGAALPPMRPWW